MGCTGSKTDVQQAEAPASSTPGGTAVPLSSSPPKNSTALGKFARAHADITLSDGGLEAEVTGWDGGCVAAEGVMSEGKHYAEFKVLKGEYLCESPRPQRCSVLRLRPLLRLPLCSPAQAPADRWRRLRRSVLPSAPPTRFLHFSNSSLPQTSA